MSMSADFDFFQKNMDSKPFAIAELPCLQIFQKTFFAPRQAVMSHCIKLDKLYQIVSFYHSLYFIVSSWTN